MKNKKIMILSLCLVISLGALLYYANALKVSAREIFEQDGYILSNQLEHEGTANAPSQFYFKANSVYEKKWPSKILFHDTEASKVILENQTYLHYTNGDMGAFADGVLVDLNTLAQKPVNFYRMKAGAILKKANTQYQMQHFGKTIAMRSALWKLSESKYVVISPEMTIHLGANNQKEVKGYLEIEIQDKGILAFRNQNVSYQTVAENSKLELSDGMMVNFNKKEVVIKDKDIFSLTQMLVDGNANIEIKPEENKSIQPAKKPEEESVDSAKTPTTPNVNPAPNRQEAIAEEEQKVIDLGDTTPPKIPETAQEDDPHAGEGSIASTPPSITLTTLQSTVVGVNIKATIHDDNEVITEAGVSVKIFEKANNKLVYNTNVAKGVRKIEEDIQNLNTNTDYILVMSATYAINSVEYTSDLLNKQFRTEMLDLTYKINEKTATSLTYKVYADKGTKMTGATLLLYTADKVEHQKIQITKENMIQASKEGYLVEFGMLKSNSRYYTKMVNVVYDDSMTISEYDSMKESKTLKATPTLTTPTVSIDKRNGVIGLYPGDVSDPDNSIQKFRYEIVDAANTGEVIYNSLRDVKGNVEVSVDGSHIQRKHNYFWRLVAIFNDNDKLVEIASPESEMFALDINNLPSIALTTTRVEHDSIVGNIQLNDNDKIILRGEYTDNKGARRRSSIKVVGTDPHAQPIPMGAAASTEVPSNWDGNMNIALNIPGGLRANTTETFKLYADVNLGENIAAGGSVNDYNRNQYYLGEVRVTTANTVPFQIQSTKNRSTEPAILNQKFVLNTRLSSAEADNEVQAQYIANTLQTINYSIYRGTIPATNTDIDNAAARLLVTGSIQAEGTSAQDHESSIRRDFFDQEGMLQSNAISYDWNTLTDQNATIVFKDGRDYVGNTIHLGDVANRVFTFQVNGGRPELPRLDTDAVDVQVIRNSQLAPGTDWVSLGTAPQADIANTAIVGLSFVPRINNSAGTVNTIRYTIRDADMNMVVSNRTETLTPTARNIPRVVVPIAEGVDGQGIDALRRGHQYIIHFEVELDLNYDGTAETTLRNRADGNDFRSLPISVPRQLAAFKTKFSYNQTSKQITFQYHLKDPDASYMRATPVAPGTTSNIAATATITPTAGAGRTETINLERSTTTTDWKTVTLTNIEPGTIRINTMILAFSQPPTTGETTISDQRIYPALENINTFFKAETKIENNQLNVVIKKADGKSDEEFRKALSYIAAGQVTVADKEAPATKVTSEYMRLEEMSNTSSDARMRIPLTSLGILVNRKLSITTTLRYINGTSTTSMDDLTATNDKVYAVEVVNPAATTPSYLFDDARTSLVAQNSTKYPANASIFKALQNTNNITFTNQTNKNITTYNAQYTGFPLRIAIGTNLVQNVMLKELSEATISTDTTAESGFQAISGTIAMQNRDGELDIVRGIDRARLSYTIDMRNATASKDGKVYFELYTQTLGSTDFGATPIATHEALIKAGRQDITLNDLKLGQTYRIKEYVKVDIPKADGTKTEQKQYLYDDNQHVIGAHYDFTTSNRVVVSDMKAALETKKDATGTVTKQMKLSFRADQIGYTKIEYVIKKWDTATSTYTTEVFKKENTTETDFKNNMTMEAPVGKEVATQLQLGVKYQVRIRIYSTKNPYGVTTETQISDDASSTLEFQLAPLRTPIIDIQLVPGIKGTTNNIRATINVDDADYASTTKKYKVQLLNKTGADITPDAIKKTEYEYSTRNNKITFSNSTTTPIEGDKEYIVQVSTDVDLYVNGTTTTHNARAMVTTLNSFGVALGDMEIVKATTDGQAELQFYGAVNLNKAKKISYTLYQMANGASVSIKDQTFDVTLQAGGQYWKHTIKGFTTSGKYSIQIQFLTENNEVIGTLNKNFVYN